MNQDLKSLSHNSFNGTMIGGGDLSPVLDRTMPVALNVSHFVVYEDTAKTLGEEEQETQSDDATIDFTQYNNSTFL